MQPETLTQSSTIRISPLLLADLDQVEKVERLAHGRHCWSRQSFIAELNKSYTRYFALYLGEKIIGFIGVWLLDYEGHITNCAVHPDYQGQGYGQQLISFLVKKCKDYKIATLTLEVRASNLAARTVYSRHGFEEVGRRKEYYQDNKEDAILMTLNLNQ